MEFKNNIYGIPRGILWEFFRSFLYSKLIKLAPMHLKHISSFGIFHSHSWNIPLIFENILLNDPSLKYFYLDITVISFCKQKQLFKKLNIIEKYWNILCKNVRKIF